MKVTILVNDVSADPALEAEHGLAMLVEGDGIRVLFDTAKTGRVLTQNATALGSSLHEVQTVALSHGHYDHTGGLAAVLALHGDAPLFLHPDALVPRYVLHPNAPSKPIGMPKEAVTLVRRLGDRICWMTSPAEIADGVWATGPIPRRTPFEDTGGRFFLDAEGRTPDLLTDDQALWLQGKEGVVVLLGCAHAGVVNTLDYVAELTGAKGIHAVIGGMHLSSANDARLKATAEALRRHNVQWIAPCHCTGERAVDVLRRAFAPYVRPCIGGTRFLA